MLIFWVKVYFKIIQQKPGDFKKFDAFFYSFN